MLVSGVTLRADDLALNMPGQEANYYTPITTRNIFNLNPPSPVTNDVPEAAVKITPNGIQDFFGTVKALFKTTGAPGKPGQAPKDQFYMLAVGERQDGIEVKNIDQKNGIVTFDNHGVVQELPLVTTGSGSGAAAGGSGNNFTQPENNNENRNFTGRGFSRFGQRGGGFNGRGMNNSSDANGGGANGNGTLRSVPSRIYQPPTSQMTPEENAILIEQRRAKLMDTPSDQRPYSPNILPTTPLTGQY